MTVYENIEIVPTRRRGYMALVYDRDGMIVRALFDRDVHMITIDAQYWRERYCGIMAMREYESD